MSGNAVVLAIQTGLLPTGTALPPLPYLVGVVVTLAIVVVALYRRTPEVTDYVVLSLAPWMALGATLYALYQYSTDVYPPLVAPLASSPTVYLTTAIAAGMVWVLVADRPADRLAPPAAPGILLIVGLGGLVAAVGLAAVVGLSDPPLLLVAPVGALVASLVSGALVWAILGRARPVVTRYAGYGGLIVIVGHVLDGISTAVGLELLGFGEQTPLSRIIIEFSAATLPSVPVLGDVWLFVLIKLALAVVVVTILADYVHDEPVEGNLLMAGVAAVGLGPGAHNIVLFVIAG